MMLWNISEGKLCASDISSEILQRTSFPKLHLCDYLVIYLLIKFSFSKKDAGKNQWNFTLDGNLFPFIF